MRIVTGTDCRARCGCVSGSDPHAPSGACAQDEQAALSLYGPPLGVSTSRNVTTYTWASATGTFTLDGSSCTESIT